MSISEEKEIEQLKSAIVEEASKKIAKYIYNITSIKDGVSERDAVKYDKILKLLENLITTAVEDDHINNVSDDDLHEMSLEILSEIEKNLKDNIVMEMVFLDTHQIILNAHIARYFSKKTNENSLFDVLEKTIQEFSKDKFPDAMGVLLKDFKKKIAIEVKTTTFSQKNFLKYFYNYSDGEETIKFLDFKEKYDDQKPQLNLDHVFLRGRSNLQLKNYEEAAGYFKTCLSLVSETKHIAAMWSWLAQCYGESEDFEEAFKYQSYVTEYSIENPDILEVSLLRILSLGYYAQKAGKEKEAVPLLERAKKACKISNLDQAIIKLAQNNNSHVENDTPKTSMLGFSVDLKFSQEDGVKICEINSIINSGLKGYSKAYDRDLRDSIGTDYKEHCAITSTEKQYPFTKASRFNGKWYSPIKNRLATIEDNAMGSPFFNNTQFEHLMCSTYKDYFLNKYADQYPDLIPKSASFPKDDFEAGLAEFIESLDDGAKLIMKPIDAAVGNGVIMVNKKDAMKKAHALFNLKQFDDESEEYFVNDVYPNFVVQEFASSDPVMATDDKHYEGTMRIVISAKYDPETGDVTPIYHGAYWKLPSLSVEERLEAESKDDGSDLSKSFISQPPSKIKEDDKNYIDRPFSAQVSDEDFRAVSELLDPFVRQYAQDCNTKASLTQFAQNAIDMFSAPDTEPAELLSELFITNSEDFGMVIHNALPLIDEDLYMRLLNQIDNIANNNEPSNRPDYVSDFAKAMIGDGFGLEKEPNTPSNTYLQGRSYTNLKLGRWPFPHAKLKKL